MTIDEFREWVATIASKGQVSGCTDEEVALLMLAQGVERLPDDYRAFLKVAGRRAGGFGKGIEMFYPLLLQTKEWMKEALEADGAPFSLPPSAFVFYSSQGYNFWYFEDAESDPPIVANWAERHRPRRLFRTFGEWLEAETDRDEQIRHNIEASSRGEAVNWTAASYDSYRTIDDDVV